MTDFVPRGKTVISASEIPLLVGYPDARCVRLEIQQDPLCVYVVLEGESLHEFFSEKGPRWARSWEEFYSPDEESNFLPKRTLRPQFSDEASSS